MQSIHKGALTFVGILLVAILAFGTRIPLAHAATTVPPDISGTWQGQGNYNSGQNTYNMLLTITSVNGSTFSGTLEEDTFNSTVAITGSTTSSSDSSSTITFTDPSTISGSQIQLNCTYTETVSNGQMTGVWYYQGHTSPDGTNSLSQTSTTTNDTRLQWATDWARKQLGSTAWGTGSNTLCQQFVENAYGVTGKFANPKAMFASIGIPASPATPGLIVVFQANNGNGGNGHAGIYMGGDQMISVQSNGVQLHSVSGWSQNVASLLGYVYPPSEWPGIYGPGAQSFGNGGLCAG